MAPPASSAYIRAGSYIFLWTTCLAAITPGRSHQIQIAQRNISKDPSCPDGWLCELQDCNAACPSGEVCIEFEGTVACAPAGQKWCALNPTTLQAIECQGDGVCCHGNCYQSGTTCCTNTAIQCAIGDLCLACPGDQTCTTGASTCAAGGGSPSSIHSTTSPSLSAIHPTTTPSSLRTSTTPATPSKTSNAAPSPTIVQQDGNVKYQGCFIDSTNSRALIVSNSTDASGMTVEKCIEAAKGQSLRFAGVEIGSQCFGGNTLHTSNKASDGDCDTICAGAPSEFCGAGNRIQVYEDTTWSDPTLDQLTQVLLQYNSSLFDLSALTTQYKGLIQQWSDQQSGNKKRWFSRIRRQSITYTQLHDGLTEINSGYSAALSIIEQAAENGNRLYLQAASRDVLRPAQDNNPFVDPPTLENAQQAFSIPLEPLKTVQSAIEDDVRTIASTNSQTPLLNTERDLRVAGAATSAVGTISGKTLGAIAAGVGVFALLAGIFLHLHPSGSSNAGSPSSSPTKPSETQPASSTSTTTSSATASATPYFIVAAKGVSENDFEAYTDKLSSEPLPKVINSPFVIARVVGLNDTAVQQVRNNKLVNSAAPNELDGLFDDPDDVGTSSRRSLGKRTNPARGTAVAGSTVYGTDLEGRDGDSGLELGHLQSLSAKWFHEDETSYNDYVFETEPGKGIWIYVIDDGVKLDHAEFSEIQKDPEIVVDNTVSQPRHGTAVAGQAVGKNLGVASSANLVSVIIGTTEDQIQDGLAQVYDDIIAKGRQGKAVVNMSWVLSRTDHRAADDYWMVEAMEKFIDIGAVPVCGAGNNGHLGGVITDYIPAYYGTYIDGLIVVGAVNDLGERWVKTQKCDAANTDSTCLTAYAMGEDVMLADGDTGRYRTSSGTSYAAPIISGLAAYLMAHPHPTIQSRVFGGGIDGIAGAIEDIITAWSWSRKPNGGVDWPNVAWNGVIVDPCESDEEDLLSDFPATPDALGTNPTLQITERPISASSSCSEKRAAKKTSRLPSRGMVSGQGGDNMICHQPMYQTDLSGYDVATGLPTEFLHEICSEASKQVMIEISLNTTTIVALVSQTRPETDDAASCHSSLQAIIKACIVKQNFFGGSYIQGNAAYSISNAAYIG